MPWTAPRPAPAPESGARILAAHLLIAALSAGALYAPRISPMAAALAGAAASAAYLYGYLRLNPRWVGAELTLLAMAGFLTQPPLHAAWLAGSGMAGAAAALLTGGGAREDHQFFLPPVAALAFTVLLYSVGRGPAGPPPARWLPQTLDQLAEAMTQALKLPENAQILEDLGGEEAALRLAPRLALISVCAVLVLWMLLLWLLGQLVRHRAGRALGLGGTILLFRIRTGYTFLLIVGLVFEILSVWFEQERLKLISYPLLGACAAGFWLVYLGVILFLLALARAAAPGRPRWMLRVLGAMALALSLYIGPFVGLADVWFDFRKMRQIRHPSR